MQDRYAGDLGDFLKFGLLRWLAPPEAPWPRLGVIWYRTADEAHNPTARTSPTSHPATGQPDGCASSTRTCMTGSPALSAPGSAAPPRWPAPACSGRRLGFFGELLDLADLPVAATSDCDLIFADPDNGIRLLLRYGGLSESEAARVAREVVQAIRTALKDPP